MTTPQPGNQPGDLQKTSGQINPLDPYGAIKSPPGTGAPEAREVNFIHTNSDRDKDQQAQHHSLGISHNQAAPGDHVHDGISSRKVGAGMNIVISGAKGGNAALTSLIAALSQVMEFTDNTT